MIKHARLAAPIAVALAGSAFASVASADELNIYSARHYDSDEALYQAFTEETGIEVNLLEGDSDQLIERITREGVASPADVMITVDAGRLWRAEQEEIFQSVDSEVLNERLPEAMRHPEGLWFGFSQRARAIFYDRESFDPSQIGSYERSSPTRSSRARCAFARRTISTTSRCSPRWSSITAPRVPRSGPRAW